MKTPLKQVDVTEETCRLVRVRDCRYVSNFWRFEHTAKSGRRVARDALYACNQGEEEYPPAGVTRRKRPPPSNSLYGLSAGFAVSTFLAASGAVCLGIVRVA
jgi:hypothetical protein